MRTVKVSYESDKGRFQQGLIEVWDNHEREIELWIGDADDFTDHLGDILNTDGLEIETLSS